MEFLQDSINEMGAKAVLKSGGNPLQNVLGSLGRSAILNPNRVEKAGKKISSSLAKMFVAAL